MLCSFHQVPAADHWSRHPWHPRHGQLPPDSHRLPERLCRQLQPEQGGAIRRHAPRVRNHPTSLGAASPTPCRYIEVDVNSSFDPSVQDLTTEIAAAVNASFSQAAPDVRLFAGEIGPHNGGSPGCNHSSLRWATYADIFWYDALRVPLCLLATNGRGLHWHQQPCN